MKNIEKLTMKTPSLADRNFAALAELFPNAITETIDENGRVVRAIDKDVLSQEINTHVVEGREERYQFTWPDKRKSILIANSPIAATLRPCREESVDFDTTENLYIEGDNLDVLKLLRETYLNRVKMIYIDPPYNTGNDFIYEDDFSEKAEAFLRRDKQVDELGNRLTPNLDSNGRFHTDWLNMIYPRLKVARDILADDGVVFVSIDDNETENLKKICNEIYGESNFLAQFVWVKKKKGSHLSKTTRSMTEYVLCYSKSFVGVELFGEQAYSDKQQPLAKRTNSRKKLVFPKCVIKTTLSNEVYKAGSYGEGSSALFFEKDFAVDNGVVISDVIVNGPFVWTQTKLDEEIRLGTSVFLSSKFGFNVLRSDQSEKIKRPSTLLDQRSNVGTNEDAYDESISIFGKEGIMSYPKPSSLVKYLVNTITYFDRDSIIMDFFSGSATTAHAVMQLNAEDGGKRKFIMVQLPEICSEESEAAKAGYGTICDIGKERIRRSGKKIQEDNPMMAGNLDVGFRVLKLDSSNLKDVYYSPDDFLVMNHDQQSFLDLADNIKEGRTDEDLLFQVMLELGIPLSAKISHRHDVFSVNDDYLIACFKKVDTALMTEIAKKKPYFVVFRDSSFTSDSEMVNFEQVFATYSPNTEKKVL